ncbi:MAG: NUDIX domain-containing protein [Polyangiaceae bacterium]
MSGIGARPASSSAPPRAPGPAIGVGGVMLDRSGSEPSVVLVKRGNPPRAGAWSLPGGRVERGERLAEAVRREVLEETGLLVRPGPLVAAVELIDDAFHYVVLDYLCEVDGGSLRAGDDAADAALVPVSELVRYGVTPAVLDVVERALGMETSRDTLLPPEDAPLDETTYSDDAVTADGTDPVL